MIKLMYSFIFLNEYINIERSNKYKAAKVKRDTTYAITLMLKGNKKVKTPTKIHYCWLIKSKRRDLDNIAHASKYINDALVKSGIIENDNLNNIVEMKHTFKISNKKGVEIEFYD